LPELLESLEDVSSLGGGGGMNWAPELEALASVVPDVALVDELLLLACSICMRIERLDPPTPLTDMSNSRVESAGRVAAKTTCRVAPGRR
jgi:hypothetical protein